METGGWTELLCLGVGDQKGVESLGNYTTNFTCLYTIACLFSFYCQQGHVIHSVCNASTHFIRICTSEI